MTDVSFKAPPKVEAKLDRLVKARKVKSRAELIRLLIDEADADPSSSSDPTSGGRLVRSGGRAKRARTAAKEMRAMKAIRAVKAAAKGIANVA